MTAEERQLLEDSGINVDDAMQRFMNNEKLWVRFLKKFEADKSYSELVAAMEEKNVEKAFESAHTLKGIAGNLALAKFLGLITEQTDYLRGKDYETAAGMMPKVAEAYESALKVIKEVYGE